MKFNSPLAPSIGTVPPSLSSKDAFFGGTADAREPWRRCPAHSSMNPPLSRPGDQRKACEKSWRKSFGGSVAYPKANGRCCSCPVSYRLLDGVAIEEQSQSHGHRRAFLQLSILVRALEHQHGRRPVWTTGAAGAGVRPQDQSLQGARFRRRAVSRRRHRPCRPRLGGDEERGRGGQDDA